MCLQKDHLLFLTSSLFYCVPTVPMCYQGCNGARYNTDVYRKGICSRCEESEHLGSRAAASRIHSAAASLQTKKTPLYYEAGALIKRGNHGQQRHRSLVGRWNHVKFQFWFSVVTECTPNHPLLHWCLSLYRKRSEPKFFFTVTPPCVTVPESRFMTCSRCYS